MIPGRRTKMQTYIDTVYKTQGQLKRQADEKTRGCDERPLVKTAANLMPTEVFSLCLKLEDVQPKKYHGPGHLFITSKIFRRV